MTDKDSELNQLRERVVNLSDEFRSRISKLEKRVDALESSLSKTSQKSSSIDVGEIKKLLSSVEGMSPSKAQSLTSAGFNSLSRLEEASEEDLTEVKGIGPKLANKIKVDLKDITSRI